MRATERIAAPPSGAEAAHNNSVWQELFARQLPRVEAFGCREYLEGLDRLPLPADRVPTLEWINSVITPRTGWRTIRTAVRYTDAVPWYQRFARREFLVTDYMRSWNELDFTPEPDMFHDIFGHLPFLALARYARLEEMFAPAFLAAGDEERENIKRLAWFSTEFGLIRQEGRLKAFGAGLISGGAELLNAVEGRTRILPFKVEAVIGHDKAVWSHNPILFEFPSIEALAAELERYFRTLLP